MNSLPKHISIFIGLVVIQTLILNQINIDGLVNPYIFPLFIILLSFETKSWVLLVSAFFLGLFIDFFTGTIGMHAFSTTLMAFVRPHFLRTFQSKSDKNNFPTIKNNGFAWMLAYVFSMISIHHICYFIIEASSFSNPFHTITLILLSIIISVFIIFLLLYTFKISKK